jgi:transposase
VITGVPVPAVPSCLIDPLFTELEALLDEKPEFSPNHPWGCHRRRIPHRVVFEHIVAAMVHGSGYEIIASAGCSDRTIRRRLKEWAGKGLGQKIHQITLAAYDKIIGLELGDLATDGCITKAPCGGDKAGPSPVDRRKGGLKRSATTDATGVPLGIVSAGANRHDSPLLAPTIENMKQQVGPLPDKPVMHLDSGYDGKPSRDVLADHNMIGEIAQKGIPSPIQIGKRWVVERTHSWMNNYGKLRRCTDRDATIVDFYLHLAAAFVTVRCLIQAARHTHRWDNRPTTRRLK